MSFEDIGESSKTASMVRAVVTLTILVTLSLNVYCYDVPPVNVTAYLDSYYVFLMEKGINISEFNIYINPNEKLESIDQAVYKETQYVPSGEEMWEIFIRWVSHPIKIGDVLNYIVAIKKDDVLYTSESRTFEVKELASPISRTIPKLILHW